MVGMENQAVRGSGLSRTHPGEVFPFGQSARDPGRRAAVRRVYAGRHTGSGAVWQRAAFGTQRSRVQIPPSRHEIELWENWASGPPRGIASEASGGPLAPERGLDDGSPPPIVTV